MTSLHVSVQAGPREVVAIKCILKSTLNKASTENLLTEIELLKNLKHQHIVALKDFLVGSVFIYKPHTIFKQIIQKSNQKRKLAEIYKITHLI